MSEKYILSLDQGTSSCRAVLVNQQGHIVAIEQAEFTQFFPNPDWVEHDPEEIWAVQMKVVHKLMTDHIPDLKQLIGIGITNQRETTVVWNKHTGKPVYNAIVWQDKRTSPYCKSLKEAGHEDYIYAQTGLKVDPYFSGTKLHWILDHTDQDHQDLLFGTIDTWLIWKLTEGRVHATDPTNASRTMLYNIRSHSWDDKLLDILSVPKGLLPEVRPSASSFGTYDYLGHSIPIAGVAGDQQAALFGQACFEPGTAKNTYGTGCFMLMNIGKEHRSSNNGLLTTVCCDEFGGVSYALEGSIFMAGASIQWLRDGLELIQDPTETETLAETVKDDHEVVVVPAFAGLGAPYWDMNSRGAIFGLSRYSTKAHLAKATLEALAYRTKDVLDAMTKDSGQALDILKVDGGACQNNYLMQFQADLLGCKVERPRVTESTALGAAYLAGITLGLWDANHIRANREVDRTFVADMESDQRISLYTQWQKAVQRSMNWLDD